MLSNLSNLFKQAAPLIAASVNLRICNQRGILGGLSGVIVVSVLTVFHTVLKTHLIQG